MQEIAKTVMWRKRIALWYESGLSKTACAEQHGLHRRRISYWTRGLPVAPEVPGLLRVKVGPPTLLVKPLAAAGPIVLRSEQEWSLTLPGDVDASWLTELMRGL